jgi:hypothetical protein
MKKLITVIAILTSSACFAQQEKGDLSIQFSGNYYSQKITYTGGQIKMTYGNIYVKFGQFFTPNIELGVKPNVSFFLQPDPNDSKKQKLKSNFGFGLYGTYSFLTSDAKMIPYAGGEINYVPVGKESTVNVGPYLGLKYFIKENINVDANMDYSFNVGSSFRNEGAKYSGLLMFNIGVGVILGKLN